MIEYVNEELFYEDSVHKEYIIHFFHVEDNEVIDDDTFTNDDLKQESMSVTESVCSQPTLMFGGCESNKIQFTLQGIRSSHLDQTFTVDLILDGDDENPFRMGTYVVKSDKPTADREGREVIGYDMLYDILNADALSWYNSLSSTFTIKQLRDSFCTAFGLTQETVELPNDDVTMTKVTKNSLSGKKVITAICELNACFGVMGRDNVFHYKFINEIIEGLYPANTLYPADDLYPREEAVGKVLHKSQYLTAKYEDYITNRITKIQVWNNTDYAALAVVGNGSNIYNIINNELVDCLNSTTANTVASNIYSLVNKVWYMICDVTAVGNPCLEVGDTIRLVTKYDVVYMVVMERSLKGIQALKDEYVSNGEEFRVDDVTSYKNDLRRNEIAANKAQSSATSAGQSAASAASAASTAQGIADSAISQAQAAASVASSAASTAQSAASTAQSAASTAQSAASTAQAAANTATAANNTANSANGRCTDGTQTITCATVRASTYQYLSGGQYADFTRRTIKDGNGNWVTVWT